MQFTLTIKLGNEAMQETADLIAALEKVASRMNDDYSCTPLRSVADYKHTIHDLNGNRVGSWEIIPDAPAERFSDEKLERARLAYERVTDYPYSRSALQAALEAADDIEVRR